MNLWHRLTQPWQILQTLPNRKPQHQSPQPSGLLTTLVRGTSTALIIQTLGVGMGYFMQVLLARWMGAANYGIYDYVITISTVLAFLAGLGLSNAVLRFVPEYSIKENWAYLRGILWGSWWQTVLASLIVVAIASGVVLWLVEENPANTLTSLRIPLLIGIWLIPLHALTKLQLEMARAVRKIGLAYFPSLVMYPLVLIAATLVWVKTQGTLTSTVAIALSILVLIGVLAGQLWQFSRGFTPEVNCIRPAYALRQWLFVSLPLLFIDGSFMILNQTDALMIGAFLGTDEVGIYGAAFKTATWVSFILLAVNAIAAPMFATLYAQGDRQELQRLVSTIARWMFYPALAAALGLFVFAEPVLRLFGDEFVVAKWAMIVLAIGQLVNVGAGSVGYLLTMTGHHNQCAKVLGVSALMNVLLNWVGIPTLGVFGAALATAISMAVWNIWLNALVVKHLGVNPSIVAAIFKRQ